VTVPTYRDSGDHRIIGVVVSVRIAGHYPICEVQCEDQESTPRHGEPAHWYTARTVYGRPSKRMVDEGDISFQPGDLVAVLAPLEPDPHRTLTIIFRRTGTP
jgi:hypothetical protein